MDLPISIREYLREKKIKIKVDICGNTVTHHRRSLVDNGLVAIPFFSLCGACNPEFGYTVVFIGEISCCTLSRGMLGFFVREI